MAGAAKPGATPPVPLADAFGTGVAGRILLFASSPVMTPLDQFLNGSTLLLRATTQTVMSVTATATPRSDAHRARARGERRGPVVMGNSSAFWPWT
jgi:hypothetical protein